MTALDEAVVVTPKRATRSVRAELAAGLSLLTRVPVATSTDATGAATFGAIGAMTGAAGAIPVLALGTVVPSVAGIAAIAVMVAISGALHLDGLADTADALVAPTEDAAERARRDPRAGPAAVATIVVALVADWSLIVATIERLDVVAAGAVLRSRAGAHAARSRGTDPGRDGDLRDSRRERSITALIRAAGASPWQRPPVAVAQYSRATLGR